MTGTQRIMTTLTGGVADKVPLMLHNFMAAANEAGLTLGEYRASARKMADAQIAFARKYDMDGLLLDVDTCMEAGAIGVPIDLPDDGPARVTGPASKDIDQIIEMMDKDKLRGYDRISIALETVNILRGEVGGEFLIRGNCDQMAYSLAMLAYGMNEFLLALTDKSKQEKIFQLMDRAYEVHLEYCKMTLEAGADIVSFGDSSCGPDLISPKMYRTYALPYHQRLQKDIAAMGAMTVCHICGNLDKIAEDVAEVGFAGVEIDYKTDIPRAAGLMRGKSTVFGPIDPSGAFYFGTPQQMEEEVNRVLDSFGGKGIVLGAGCAIPPGTPEANFRAFTRAGRAYPIR